MKTLRQSLFMTRGSFVDILTRPITMTLLLLGLAAVVVPWVVRRLRRGVPIVSLPDATR